MKGNNTNTNTADTGGDDGDDGRKEYKSIGVRPETKSTVKQIQDLTDKHQTDIVDEALAEYLHSILWNLVDEHNPRNQLTVEYNGEVVYTDDFGYDIEEDELVEIVSEYVLSESDHL